MSLILNYSTNTFEVFFGTKIQLMDKLFADYPCWSDIYVLDNSDEYEVHLDKADEWYDIYFKGGDIKFKVKDNPGFAIDLLEVQGIGSLDWGYPNADFVVYGYDYEDTIKILNENNIEYEVF